MDNTTRDDEMEQQYLEATSYASMVLAAVGLLGNSLCARMMLTSPMKPYSSALFMLFANISDSIVLIYDVIDDIAVHIDGYDRDKILYGGNEWRCRFGVFFYEVARVISAWAVIAMAAELTIVGGSPAKKGVVYNRNRSFYISMAVCLIAVAGCFPFLVIVSKAEGEDGCSSKYQVFMEIYSHVVLHMFVNSLLPFALIVACSIHSLYRLSVNAEEQRSSTYVEPGKDAVKFQLPRGILSLSFVYVISVLPLALIDLCYFVQRLETTMNLQQPAWDYAHIIAQCIFLVNFSAKFYLIILIEPQLRKGISHIMNCGILKSRQVSSKYLADEDNSYNVRNNRI